MGANRPITAWLEGSFGRIARWVALFVAVVAGLWFSTRSTVAPQIILLLVLYVITLNFSIPTTGGVNSLAPLAALIGGLAVELPTALLTLIGGALLAGVASPLWQPLWRQTGAKPPAWTTRAAYVACLIVGVAGAELASSALAPELGLSEPVMYAVTLTVLVQLLGLLLWLPRHALSAYASESGLFSVGLVLAAALLAATGITTAETLPQFVLLVLGVGAAAIVVWTWWRQRYVMERRIAEFAALNRVGATLRESLDYGTVLTQIVDMTRALVPVAEQVMVVLRHADDAWEQVTPLGVSAESTTRYAPDDFVRHVVDRNKVLDLDSDNMHFADRHNLTPPAPRPRVWLGLPLTAGDEVIGALVLQKIVADEPFTRWHQELLLSIAGQASAAIQNARLYGETVRLYNQTDQALAHRVEQLQALLNSTTEGVIMVDRSRQVVLANPTAAAMLGQPLAALQSPAFELASVADRLGYQPQELTARLAQLHQGQQPVAQRAQFALNGAQSRRFIEREDVPVSAENDELMGWLIILRDVTEERERAEWRADLTRMIVHDLRNPITTLSTTVSQIEQTLDATEKAALGQLLLTARYGCADMLEMVDSLMDINRAEAGTLIVDPDAVRLSRLAQGVVDQIAPLAQRRGIALHVDSAEAVPLAWADSELTRRVLTNLIDNALKFTPAGGRVWLALQPEPALPSHDPGNRITVFDTGPGIPHAMRERIFDRFITFNRGGGQIRGTGLGLTFCKLAVEHQGGEIWVEDGPEGGSAFVFTLPGIPHLTA